MTKEKTTEKELFPGESTGQEVELQEKEEIPGTGIKKEKTGKKIPAFLEPYLKAYPGERTFHVTSDKQVFLEKDFNLARFHQKGLKNGEKVQTIKVK